MEKIAAKSSNHPNFQPDELVLLLSNPAGKSPISISDLILDVIKDFLIKIGLSIEPNYNKTEFKLRFKDYTTFKKFHLEILPQMPFDTDQQTEPYTMRISYEYIPSDLEFEEILQISTIPYNKMKIQIQYNSENDYFDLIFPSQEAYFMMFLSVVGIDKILNM